MATATSRLAACFLLLGSVLLSGCATMFSTTERPESLDPVAVDAPPDRAYDEALTLAFDRGYNINYSSREERLIELDALDRRLFFQPHVRRIDLYVRERNGQTFIHARYHSYDTQDPNDIDIRDSDREATRAFIDDLVTRLGGVALDDRG